VSRGSCSARRLPPPRSPSHMPSAPASEAAGRPHLPGHSSAAERLIITFEVACGVPTRDERPQHRIPIVLSNRPPRTCIRRFRRQDLSTSLQCGTAPAPCPR
jgi:hypothetical protein